MRYFMKIFLLLILFSSMGMAYMERDSDFDGVSDSRDACPNTPFSDLVDARGCSVKKVPLAKEVATLSVVIGSHYTYYSDGTNQTKTLSQSLELDYEIKKIKVQLAVSHFNAKNRPFSQYNDANFGDTTLFLTYQLDPILAHLELYVTGGLIIPTYQGSLKNNRLDISSSISANYMIDKLSLFGGITYTIVGDKDTSYLSYTNTNAFNLGAGYSFNSRLYSSLSWYWSDSMIQSGAKTKSISWFNYITLTPRLYSTFSLTHDIVDHALSHNYGVQIGYRL